MDISQHSYGCIFCWSSFPKIFWCSDYCSHNLCVCAIMSDFMPSAQNCCFPPCIAVTSRETSTVEVFFSGFSEFFLGQRINWLNSYNKGNNKNYNNIIIITILHEIIFIVLSFTEHSHMWDFTLGPLSESRSAPGGHQLVGQAPNLTFQPICRLVLRSKAKTLTGNFLFS